MRPIAGTCSPSSMLMQRARLRTIRSPMGPVTQEVILRNMTPGSAVLVVKSQGSETANGHTELEVPAGTMDYNPKRRPAAESDIADCNRQVVDWYWWMRQEEQQAQCAS